MLLPGAPDDDHGRGYYVPSEAQQEPQGPKKIVEASLLQEIVATLGMHEQRVEQLLINQERRINDSLRSWIVDGSGNSSYYPGFVHPVSSPARSTIATANVHFSRPVSAKSQSGTLVQSTYHPASGIKVQFRKTLKPHAPPEDMDPPLPIEQAPTDKSPRDVSDDEVILGDTRESTATKADALEDEFKRRVSYQKTLMEGTGRNEAWSMKASMPKIDSWAACKTACRDFIKSRFFELVSAVLIFINSLFIAADTDFAVVNPGDQLPTYFVAVNTIFVIIFGVELLLRVAADGCHFYSSKHSGIAWNIFDTLLVLSSLVEEGLNFWNRMSEDSGSNKIGTDAMQTLRLLRLVRAFRIVRVVRIFSDLRMMLTGIASAMKPMFWAVVVLFAIIYLVAMALLQFAAEEFLAKAASTDGGVLSQEDYDLLSEHYSGLLPTFYTLYKAICGGIDWGDAAHPMFKIHTGLGIIFCTYIAFAVLCVLNIMTGQFVEAANRMAANDDEMIMAEQQFQRARLVNDLQRIFALGDVDQSGELNYEEVMVILKDAKMQSWLRKLGVEVDAYNASDLFSILDFDENGSLSIDEFLTAMQAVRGVARSIDLARALQEIKSVKTDVQDLCIKVTAIAKKQHR